MKLILVVYIVNIDQNSAPPQALDPEREKLRLEQGSSLSAAVVDTLPSAF